jgi:hypothetical protein
MVLRIPVDVDDQLAEIGVGRDLDATKRVLKHASCAAVCPVEGLGVGGKEVGESLARVRGVGAQHIGPRVDEKVEVVPHQAVGEGVGNRFYVPCIAAKKEVVVALLAKEVLAVCAAVVDVIVCVEL